MSIKSYVYRKLRSKKFWKRLVISIVIVPIVLFFALVGILYWKQDAIVQHLLSSMNEDFKGRIEITGSHISPFEEFPYISIDLEGVKIYEDKKTHKKPILAIDDAYLGFDLWTIISGKMEIKMLELNGGHIDLVQHKDGEFNVVKAFASNKPIENASEEFHLDLKEVDLKNIEFTKLNEANNLLIEAGINYADIVFKTSPRHVYASLESKLQLNVISNGDTTFIKHKHFDLDTEIDFFTEKEIMTVRPTNVKLEGAEFKMSGKIDFLNDAYMDFKFSGDKPDFALFMAMAPEEIHPILEQYDNKGKIHFDARVVGKSTNGHRPYIKANFACKEAYFDNTVAHKKLDQLGFKGYFSNGKNRDFSTMEFRLENFTARPEAGKFTGDLYVKNFESPEINLKLKSNFKLDFLAKFFNIKGLSQLDGNIALTMNFKDIIDLNHPERSLEKLNESYLTTLKVSNLRFKSTAYRLPVRDIDMYAEMKGHIARIEYFKIKVGKSDFDLSGIISDFPAIVHHSANPVKTDLSIKCRKLDLFELTGGDSLTSINEKFRKVSLDLSFISSARAITESKSLPVGEFFIRNMTAKLKQYPHSFNDFHADILIDEKDIRVKDFKGKIDKSDFLFSGMLYDYNLLMSKHSTGETKFEFNFNSTMLQLTDIFSYKGQNYVPEDYRHEEFDNLKLHGMSYLHYNDGLKSLDMTIDRFDGKMKVHPLRFEHFKGRIHYESEHLVIENFSGKMGHSDFHTTLHYYLGKNEAIRKRENHFELTASRLDLDQLLAYNPAPVKEGAVKPVNHDAGFNIYDLPFTNMTFDLNIAHLNYHRYLLNDVKTKFKTTKNHHINIEKCHMNAAGGSIEISGDFNGADPHKIYFTPNIHIKHADIDKLLFKFENFGQDHLVSENLHGKFTGTITGKIHMHNDLVPKIDDSEIHLDMLITNGKLQNYAMFEYMSDYFADKNLKSVHFDTLKNHIDLTKGVLTLPNMTINTSIGFMQVSGKQDMNLNMEYYFKIPWKMVTEAGSSKLFGKKTEEVDPGQVDAIQYADPEKKIRYVNIKLTGNAETYKISLGKDKSHKQKSAH
ncbi:MAG TPA: AsmA-like C-terminal region-containing protein [Flavobacteriales bacterium]|nr:AsmA-like C-terminal region-containing protein [Flavobacteriales bacterium]